MINVIISHDVDHLFSRDHWFRDLIYPKLWVRSSLQLIKHEINFRQWYLRCFSCFRKNRHNIDSIMSFDSSFDVPSTFFFGMKKGKGMSYSYKEAAPVIKKVLKTGFSAGVHGVCYDNLEGIIEEKERFFSEVGVEPCGIRMHYVRFNESTFYYENEAGYVFDSTEFDKKKCGTLMNPYKIGKMWEFPLTIMDGYLPQRFENAKQKMLDILEECKRNNIHFISILFHDYQFCDDYSDIRDWYTWLIDYLHQSSDYRFISYVDAIKELEGQPGK